MVLPVKVLTKISFRRASCTHPAACLHQRAIACKPCRLQGNEICRLSCTPTTLLFACNPPSSHCLRSSNHELDQGLLQQHDELVDQARTPWCADLQHAELQLWASWKQADQSVTESEWHGVASVSETCQCRLVSESLVRPAIVHGFAMPSGGIVLHGTPSHQQCEAENLFRDSCLPWGVPWQKNQL